MKRNTGIEDLLQPVHVKLRGVRAGTAGGQFHHGNNDLMIQAMVSNTFPGVFEVADVIEGVEISDGGHAVFFEHLGMKIDNIPWTLTERHHIDATGQGLQGDIRTDFGPEAVHHIEGRFSAVEE